MTKLRVLDLFSGIGGFSLGLERAGMQAVAFCEIDPYCRAVLRKHWPDAKIYEDVKELQLLDLHLDGILPIDVICGGFPCQDISVAGKGAGIDGERSGLWAEYARLIGEIRPQYVIVENVAALLGRGLDRVLGDLSTLGYDAEWHCIPASYVGAPHRRDRVWIVAYPMCRRNGAPEAIYQSALDKERNFAAQGEGWQAESSQVGGNGYVADPGGAERHGRSGWAWWWSREPEEALRDDRLRGGQEDDVRHPELQLGRVAYGVPHNVDRLGALGNAVVPQIPEIIGRAIVKCSGSRLLQAQAK